jgi:catechol 2,3-dioxygenase-like lactoylglutathione lyase family enzyme
MLESSDLVAFVAATDLDRALVFYEQTLGLRVLERSDFAVVLDANGTMLGREDGSDSGGARRQPSSGVRPLARVDAAPARLHHRRQARHHG